MKGLLIIVVFAVAIIAILALSLQESFTPEEQNVSSKLQDYLNKQAAKGPADFSNYIDFLISTGYTKQGLISLQAYYAMFDLAAKGRLTQNDIVTRM